MNLIEQIREQIDLETYIEKVTGQTFKNTGLWKTIYECPICQGHDCARLSPDGHFHCFQCWVTAFNVIQFRSHYENIDFKESLEKFREELGIKKYAKRDVDWITIREKACEYMKEVLFTCETKYRFRDQEMIPRDYLSQVRKHSHEAILHFRLGFNDGSILDFLKKDYSEEVLKASGFMTAKGYSVIPDGCLVYPFMVKGEILYFRIKDPNKLKKVQMPLNTRSKNAIWYNQDAIQEDHEIFLVEGEDDVISLWDCGVNVAGSVGMLTPIQIEYVKSHPPSCIYLAFDPDTTGRRDVDVFIRTFENSNSYIVQVPDGKDIDDLVRESDNKNGLIEQLKVSVKIPTPEERSIIQVKPDGYYIDKMTKLGTRVEKRLTNWTAEIEAVILKYTDVGEKRIKKVKIKSEKEEVILYIPGDAFASVNKFKEFLYNAANRFLLFLGNDYDLTSLVQYFELKFKPKLVVQSDCVGEIGPGFIAENLYISNSGDFKPLTNGFLSLDDHNSIQIVELATKGGGHSGLPYFPLVEPVGGIDEYKKRVFDMLIRNRNLKVGIGIGWMKATLWSTMFFKKYRFFPILMFHGKHASGKSRLANWLMSLVGMREIQGIPLTERGTTEVGLARKFAYYSALPVFLDDYRNEKETGQKFHTFFRNVFDRSCSPKGIKSDWGVREVPIRGCLLLNGETSPNDPGLVSRIISIELTEQERDAKYWQTILKTEPGFAAIGLDWLKHRMDGFQGFIETYAKIEPILAKKIDNGRQASIWSVAVAGALTEPYFKQDELIDFAVNSANFEIKERQGEELIGSLWEATEILNQKEALKGLLDFDYPKIRMHLPGLLNAIAADPGLNRRYYFPGHREVAKILRQEPYILELKQIKINNKVAWRWVMDIDKCPDVLQGIFLDPLELKLRKDENVENNAESQTENTDDEV